ncbi:hypothetical protein [Microlunatus sp. Y2014]|uniref:hypothetical protein n=1 Tax=Microlunatus sp. Y2014 TaxID=3418488 RepID=UPI003DA75405
MPMNVNRRTLLGGAAAAGLGLVGGAGLAACSPGTGSPGSGASEGPSGAVELPAYIPYTGVEPDAPATDTGAAPYFAKFPAEPVQFTDGKPMAGGEVNILTFLNTTPTPVERNPWWQDINAALGGTMTFTGAPVGEYPSKFQVVVAGNDIPDLAVIMAGAVPQVGRLLQAKFADLSPYLSGDKIKDYPGLANIPTVAWRGCVFNKGIYTLPIQRFSLNRCWITRVDLAEKYGVDPQPKNGDELLTFLRGLTHPDQKVFATAHLWGLVDLFHEMHGTPNQWAVGEDGTFTKDYETDAYKAVLEVAAQVWKERLVHPEGFDPNITLKTQDMYNNGMTPFFPGVASWSGNAIAALKADPAAQSVALKVNTWDGSNPAGRWLNSGAPYLTAIKQASPERIQEMLRVANYLASPFGTKEYVLYQYGAEGRDFTLEDGVPVPNPDSAPNRPSPMIYAGAPAMIHNGTVNPEVSRNEYEAEVLGMATAVPLPTVGLESATDQSKGAALTREMKDLAADIIQARKPLSAWDEGVKEWRNDGGDKIREEYQEAYQAAQ